MSESVELSFARGGGTVNVECSSAVATEIICASLALESYQVVLVDDRHAEIGPVNSDADLRCIVERVCCALELAHYDITWDGSQWLPGTTRLPCLLVKILDALGRSSGGDMPMV